MNLTWQMLALGLLWAGAIGGLVWYALRAGLEMTYVTLADGRRQERRIPFGFRILLPLASNMAPFFQKPQFARQRAALERPLVMAGFEGLLTPADFLALRTVFTVLAGTTMAILLHVAISQLTGRMGAMLVAREWMLILAVFLWSFAHPGLWLRNAVSQRHRKIERALPFVMDLLTLSVEAGIDLMAAIQRLFTRQPLDPLVEELLRMFREVQLGKTRRESLRDMAERVGQPDLRSITHAMVQADELGVSIGQILRIQSDQLRVRRFQRAEKLANEAPVKMLAPLVLFIFPAVFLVLLGPVFLQLMRHGF